VYVPDRKERSAGKGGRIDPKTGKLIYDYSGKTYTETTVSKSGVINVKERPKTIKSKGLAEVDDAYKLTSGGSKKNPGTTMEGLYADHSNRMKALANEARLATLKVPTVKRSPSATKVYATEVASLKAQLEVALKNAPLERKALIVGNSIVKLKADANPNMPKEDLKKIKNQAMAEARVRVGAKKTRITITPREWEAIQANAVSSNMLSQILRNTDAEHVKTLATPRARTVMTDAKIARAKMMLRTNHTQAEIAAALGVPASTLRDALF
jgi:hypothetical protein